VSVLVQGFVRPEGHQLRLLVRVPLGAMRDVEFPLRGDGLLDLPAPTRRCARRPHSGSRKTSRGLRGDTPLGIPRVAAARVSLPSDRSFVTYDTALAQVTGPPLAADTTLYWTQALLDVLLEYPIQSDRASFSIRPSLARLGVHVVTVVRYQPPAGAERAFELPAIGWSLDPLWHQAAGGSSSSASFTSSTARTICCCAVPGNPFRSSAARRDRDGVHGGFDHALASAFNLAPARCGSRRSWRR
jgi:hypothetical protein